MQLAAPNLPAAPYQAATRPHSLPRLAAQHQRLIHDAQACRRGELLYALGATSCLLAVPAVMVGSAHNMVQRFGEAGYMSRRTMLMMPAAFGTSSILADTGADLFERSKRARNNAQPFEEMAADIREEVAAWQSSVISSLE